MTSWKNQIWKTIIDQGKIWRKAILPGALIVCLIMLLRFTGVLQGQEWMAFDHLMRLRPSVAHASRVVIVGIDEVDLKLMGSYPLPDQILAKMIQILNQYHPRVIGLDLFTDVPVGSGRKELIRTLQDSSNLIGIEVALNSDPTFNIQPPKEVPPERIGFADLIEDRDGKLRRSLLSSRDFNQELKYSFPLKISQAYLNSEGIYLNHGSFEFKPNLPRDPTILANLKSTEPIQFGATKIPRFLENTGGYIDADANGNQVLLNFNTSPKPFPVIFVRDLLEENFSPDLIQDRIVLVGVTAARNKDIFLTAAVKRTLVSSEIQSKDSANKIIYGVEIHAHAVEQILRAVLDGRPLLKSWSEFTEYLWLILWGFLGIAFGIIISSPFISLLCITIAGVALFLICYFALLVGWWIPLFPTMLALSAAGLTTTFFDRSLRVELEQRRQTIERTYNAVHNGPLQHLAVILRTTEQGTAEAAQLRSQLQKLNQELRNIYESMRKEVGNPEESFYLQDDVVLYLQTPISELLYQVYDQTLERDFPGFKTILTYIPPDFSCLKNSNFNSEQKRELCVFLQEALCNVGKHAVNPTRLDVICRQIAGRYYLQIVDNGKNPTELSSVHMGKGQGTKQADNLARKLKGRFGRRQNSPRGILCELTWPVQKSSVLALLESTFNHFRRIKRWLKNLRLKQ
ncbi:MAG: CHASE2 domain-containing protein [Xenococcaceae cyanobacterium MO_207.B15]|nr:CHASE2 domain-containing protein [Xenococcaceae cyanobacterium MO_207.B15]